MSQLIKNMQLTFEQRVIEATKQLANRLKKVKNVKEGEEKI